MKLYSQVCYRQRCRPGAALSSQQISHRVPVFAISEIPSSCRKTVVPTLPSLEFPQNSLPRIRPEFATKLHDNPGCDSSLIKPGEARPLQEYLISDPIFLDNGILSRNTDTYINAYLTRRKVCENNNKHRRQIT